MREIVFDTETTGLSPQEGHRLVEIGCVEIVNRVPTGQTFHAYINPERSMPSEAEAVHGLSAIFLSDKPCFHLVAEELIAFLGDSPLVAHNATFDFAFLNWELAQCGHPSVAMTRMIDTLAIARTRHPGAKHSLDALCSRYGVDRSQRVKHGALLDAELLAQVYVELCGGRQIGFMLAAENADAAISAEAVAVRNAAPLIVRPPRPHHASAAELERHAAFIQKLVDPLWAQVPATA
ncbi:DNA polymerase III subunit epsilon [Sphingomonas nostoxanthinifaciens]|uniref:DNA polymerase III subunit epsilon n=1 Tax=Sphingomonas nostoxanthinifaciens TaxID=2872652 RepID=UPI001CC1F5C6|nr:DNA polymerase III subunit epsilon [Sphingomonas nostoxanthinifaciens]UAK24646.1 DNA polymerase III subunit epsilon [Sphingomonas nostoxanthinifaciens]